MYYQSYHSNTSTSKSADNLYLAATLFSANSLIETWAVFARHENGIGRQFNLVAELAAVVLECWDNMSTDIICHNINSKSKSWLDLVQAIEVKISF